MNIFKFFIYTVHNPRFNLFRLPDIFFLSMILEFLLLILKLLIKLYTEDKSREKLV